jgi:uncharacterized protein YkwD
MRLLVLRLAPVLASVVLVGPFVLPAFAQASCAGASARPSSAHAAVVSAATLCLLNRERAHHGLGSLRANASLELAAWRHSRDMALHNFFAHGNFVGRLARAGYFRGRRSWTVGENIAWGAGSHATPASIVWGWMHSPPHRANILNGGFHQIGVGLVNGAPVPRVLRAATYTTDFGG